MRGRYGNRFLGLELCGYNSPLQRRFCALERGVRGVSKNRMMIKTQNFYTPLNPLSLTHRLSHRGDFSSGRIWFALIFFTCFSLLSFSQEVTVTATVDSQSITIGDWIRYTVDIEYPGGTAVAVPSLKDTLGLFDIVQQDSLMRSEENGTVTLKKNFVITRFEAGNLMVPPFVVYYRDASGNILTAQSNPIPVEVRGVEVDTSRSIYDLKPPLSVPMSAEEIALYVALVLLAAAAGYGIYYYVQRKKRIVDVAEETMPDIPPHVLALLQLDELEEKQLWQKGESKLFYSEATEILRRYFERRYGILALEMTTGEVMEQLKKFKIEKGMFSTIEQLLSDADLVKFAKYQPAARENEDVIPTARTIVEKTKPIEQNVQSMPAKEVASANV